MIALPSIDLLTFVETTYRQQHLGIKQASIGQYATTVNLLNRFAGRRVTTRELSEELVVEFLNWLFANGRTSPTVNAKRRNLSAIWKFAWEKNLAPEPAKLPRMKEPKRLPKAWKLEQMEALITACYEAPLRRGWEGIHWVALVMVIYDTGLRISAVLKLRTLQLDLDGGVLRVDWDQQKDDEEMEFRLHPQTIACLKDALLGTGPRGRIFPWPFTQRQIWSQFRQILDRAGLPSDRRSLFHRLRRTSASWLESVRPGAAQEHLGHGDRATTTRYIDREIAGTAINAAALLPRFTISRPADPQGWLF